MAVKALKPVGAALVVAIAIAAYLFFLRDNSPQSYIETTGVMEATEAELAPRIAGRIEWLCCVEGDRVEAAAVALKLDARELQARLMEGKASALAAEEAVAQARIAAENAVVAKEAASSGKDAARAEEARALALEKDTSANFQRAEGLFDGGYLSKRDLDAARSAYESNLALLASAGARSRSAEANLRSAGFGIKAADAAVAAALARKEAAAAQVKVLSAQLADTEVLAPFSGVVSYKAFEAGEYVTPGAAVYTVYSPESMWARVDIEETRVQDVKLQGRALITPSGGGRSFEGAVTEIGELGVFATQRDVTRGRSDIKTFRVKVRAVANEGTLKPGMTVGVRIFLNGTEDAGDRDSRPR